MNHESNPRPTTRSRMSDWGILLGPIFAIGLYFATRSQGLPLEASCMAAIVGWMAVWWMTEAVPLAATALLPLILFPLLPVYPQHPIPNEVVWVPANVLEQPSGQRAEPTGAFMQGRVVRSDAGMAWVDVGTDAETTQRLEVESDVLRRTDTRSPFVRAASGFSNKFIFLFMGGFMIALTIERWNLHRRIALLTLRGFGTSPSMIVAGFMAATALLSMWISNTACTVMMLPIAVSVMQHVTEPRANAKGPGADATHPSRDQERFATCLMLGIAYAASIGGISTIVGTPPNALLASFLAQLDRPISFVEWLMFALPISALLLVATWLLLTKVVFRFRLPALQEGKQLIRDELQRLGPLSAGERAALVVFLCTATLWIFRKPMSGIPLVQTWLPFLERMDDTTVALLGGLSLFLIPIQWKPMQMALDWRTARKLPWGILLLFGGGLSLADGVQASGLGAAIGQWVGNQTDLSLLGMIVLTTVVVVFLTEVTSNVATTSLFLPILYQISFGVHNSAGEPIAPEFLLVPATLSASLAFMLPVATPPNAIVFASDRVTIPQMVRAGFLLNLLGILLIPPFVWWIAPTLLDFR